MSGAQRFLRSPKVPYLLGFLHPVGLWKRVPLSPPVECSPLFAIIRNPQ
jgi:hypothetical protein